MIFNVVTAFSRLQNFDYLAMSLKYEGVEWHIIEDENPFHELVVRNNWMHYYRCNNIGKSFWERCHYALNWFLDRGIQEDQYYSFLNDDDSYEPGFFNKIRQAQPLSSDLMVVSMKRGDKTPDDVDPLRAHGTGTLIASAENMKPGYVGLEQIIVRGEILQAARIPLTPDGDGRMIQWLVDNCTPTYLPDAYVWFNYWEPGRWQKSSL